MSKSAADYAVLLRQLLPPGRVISSDNDSNLEQLLQAIAEEFARVDGRATNLLSEQPDTTTELLYDWERVAGLPDNCSGNLADTMQGRRAALVAKLASVGGQSEAYFIGVAKALGYDISITTFKPFKAGMSAAGDGVYNDDWVHVWQVVAPGTTVFEFKAGQSAAGEPLRSWGNEALECKINQLKPAHTKVLFSYGSMELEQTIAVLNRAVYFMNYTLPSALD